MHTDIKQIRADILFKVASKSKFLQLLLLSSETDNWIPKTHAENEPKYISVRNNLWNALYPRKET